MPRGECELLDDIKKYSMHIVLGIGLIGIGIWLIVNDRFFIWPPELLDFANDDIWGFSFILTGLGLLLWVTDNKRTVRWGKILLSVTSWLMTYLTVYQFLIWTVTGHYMSWISNAIITAIVLIVARESDTRDD